MTTGRINQVTILFGAWPGDLSTKSDRRPDGPPARAAGVVKLEGEARQERPRDPGGPEAGGAHPLTDLESHPFSPPEFPEAPSAAVAIGPRRLHDPWHGRRRRGLSFTDHIPEDGYRIGRTPDFVG